MARQLWIADALREKGLEVIEISGWKTRGSSYFYPKGVVAHHTASNKNSGPVPALYTCIYGRPDVSGPLCQVLIGRDSKCRVIASGRANHAGYGGWRGLSGNTHVLGIEVENNGIGEPWSAQLMDTYFKAAAALLEGIRKDHTWVCGHKEWTWRKIDPYPVNMKMFRNSVKNEIGATYTEPKVEWNPVSKFPIGLGDYGNIVKEIQARCNFWGFDAGPADGWFGSKTDVGVRKFQGFLGVVVDGIWGTKSELAFNNFIDAINEGRHILASGVALSYGEMLHSINGKYALVMQTDGNLVVYDDDSNPIWATWTQHTNVDRLQMQSDGNLVLYEDANAVWHTHTYGNEGKEAYLMMQDDGNLVIYAGSNPLWSSKYGLVPR